MARTEDVAAIDALCAALQVINHLQDCAKDYRELDRVYIPLDALAAAGIDVAALAATAASPALRACIRDSGAHERGCWNSAGHSRRRSRICGWRSKSP